jgi:hypothetical protein
METTLTNQEHNNPTIQATKVPNLIITIRDLEIGTIANKVIYMSRPTIKLIRVLVLKITKVTIISPTETILDIRLTIIQIVDAMTPSAEISLGTTKGGRISNNTLKITLEIGIKYRWKAKIGNSKKITRTLLMVILTGAAIEALTKSE